jgi:hypothetical protein
MNSFIILTKPKETQYYSYISQRNSRNILTYAGEQLDNSYISQEQLDKSYISQMNSWISLI